MTATRRRLLVYSAPVVVIVLLFAVKLISAVLAGNAAVSHFAESDGAALERDAGVLGIVNIIEPARAPFAAGTAAALQGRLDDADREFSQALARTDQRDSCSVRVNLAVVREAQGDNAAATFDAQPAVDHYLAAKRVLEQAPADCLDAHTDTTARLDSKVAAVATPPPPPAPRPSLPPPATVPAAPAPGSVPPADQGNRLDPGQGDPMERLRRILQDAAR
ncbi:hypothetical protein [Mycolicibacterium diernhoferi]|uniref:Uncharacterized protein n=1 Tax=Mycolicibacterium diernhoferi TaxID=1801 RepID=A0A1Q4H621_9MYCO|nr:hypothetical protein [Mycolicibacterium diernhoferi]OJZ62937.1 hypothetical protein BRW64_24855 [Mycolicibacterium diernhoferi]OPE53420.1 hypothetical protein BV510_15645 [Mycolicibacterium diernhoferi]PEG54755.1 hypothetical protein CRI78_09640 [Mycolicibacterium diernhoferi]QYL22976.1 hypothetical protein K0O62_00975 [Mycolicibacterium diernhoferi]